MIELENKRIAIYGVGKSFKNNTKFICEHLKPIVCVDQNESLHGNEILPNVKCIFLEELDSWNIDLVIITIQDRLISTNIRKKLESKYEVKNFMDLYDKAEVEKFDSSMNRTVSNNIMHFACGMGSSLCNMECSYCYVDFTDPKLKHNSSFPHSIDFILRALSPKRLGSYAFFSMCSDGETMLKPGIIELTYGLLEEGHYVGLITNGTVTEKVKQLIAFPELLRKRLLVQNSMHFDELKKKKSFEVYFNNINALRRSGISVNATMPGSDEDVKNIPEIKELFMKNIAFLPMISPIRGEKREEQKGFPLGSKYSWDEYMDVWKNFKSPSIESRRHTLNHIEEKCYAGMNCGYINLQTGDLLTCVPGRKLGNIYKDIMGEFPLLKEGSYTCPYEFCSHNGFFLSGREINGAVLPTLYEFHNRYDINGNPTFSDEIKKAMDYICNVE